MTPQFPPTWRPFFVQPATRQPLVPPVYPRQLTGASVPARPQLGGFATGGHAARDGGGTSAGAAPPVPPRPPVEQRPTPPEPPRRALELAWLTCQMPAWMREAAIFNLRQTLNWRAQQCKPLKQPKKPLAITRFGLLGEQLWPKGALTVRRTLKKEVRESVRVVEGTQPHLERNYLLAMRGARLGQLCADLEERGFDALEVLRCELTWLWN